MNELIGDAFVIGAMVRTTEFMPTLFKAGMVGEIKGKFEYDTHNYVWVEFEGIDELVPVLIYSLEVIEQVASSEPEPVSLVEFLKDYLICVANSEASAQRLSVQQGSSYHEGRAAAYNQIRTELMQVYKELIGTVGPMPFAEVPTGVRLFPNADSAKLYVQTNLAFAPMRYTVQEWINTGFYCVVLDAKGLPQMLRNNGMFA